MGMTVPLLVKRQCTVPIRLASALPRTIALHTLHTPRTLFRACAARTAKARRAALTAHGGIVGHIIIRWIDTLGTRAELLPSPQQLLLGDVNGRMFGAASILVVFARGGDGRGAGCDTSLGGLGGHRTFIIILVFRPTIATTARP